MTIIRDLPWLAGWLGISSEQLAVYMAEDELPAYTGVASADDGKVLYAIVRTLKPAHCLEIGTGRGGSAGHVALALEKNSFGNLLTMDIDLTSGFYDAPQNLRRRVAVIHADANIELETMSEFDFIHEDGNHSMHQIHTVYNRVQNGLLNPGGIILSHDALMFSDTPGIDSIGEYIRYGIEAAGLTFPPVEYLRPAPLSCGFTVYRKS